MAINEGIQGKQEDQKQIREANRKLDQSKMLQEFYRRYVGIRGDQKANAGLESRRAILCKFFRSIGVDPDQWFEEVRTGKRDHGQDFNEYLVKIAGNKELSDGSLKATRAAFLKFAKVMKLPEPDLEAIGSSKAKNHVEVITKENLKALLNCSRNPRDRAIIMLASTAGLRISEIGGLKNKDVKELFERDHEPYAVRVPEEIAKGSRGYISFTNEETADALRTYIQTIKHEDEDPLFPTLQGGPMSRRDIENIYHNIVLRSKLPGKRVFHGLRKYCRLSLARHVSDIFAEKIIGHGGGTLEQIYTPAKIEELRSEYAKALPEFNLWTTNGNNKISDLQGQIKELETKLANETKRWKNLETSLSSLKENEQNRVFFVNDSGEMIEAVIRDKKKDPKSAKSPEEEKERPRTA